MGACGNAERVVASGIKISHSTGEVYYPGNIKHRDNAERVVASGIKISHPTGEVYYTGSIKHRGFLAIFEKYVTPKS